MRSSFILNTFPDEVWAATTEQPNSHKQEPAVTRHSISSCPAICEETDYTSETQREEKIPWNISTSEPGDTVASGSRLKSKQQLFRPAGGILHQQLASETVETKRGYVAPRGFNAEVHTVTETAARVHTEGPPLQGDHNLERIGLMEITVELETESKTKAGADENTEHKMETRRLHRSDTQLEKRRRETNYTEGTKLGRKGERREVLVVPPVGCEESAGE